MKNSEIRILYNHIKLKGPQCKNFNSEWKLYSNVYLYGKDFSKIQISKTGELLADISFCITD